MLGDREDVFERIAKNFQARERTVRTWLKRRRVTTQRWVKVEYGNRNRHRSFARPSAFLDISDRSLAHIFFFFIPERLQGEIMYQCQYQESMIMVTWR